MNREKIKKALAGLGIAGLITGVGLMSTGCQSGDKADKAKGEAETKVEAKTSCGQGMEADTTKGSCGQGSCGQEAAKKDTTAKSSCGQGSCSK